MTTPEEKDRIETPSNTFRVFFGSIFLRAPRLIPRIQKEKDGAISFDIDLDHENAAEALNELETELNHPRLKAFKERVLSGDSTAWYKAVFGGISIVVVSAVVGVEVGARHGKDIKRIFAILEERKNNQNNTP